MKGRKLLFYTLSTALMPLMCWAQGYKVKPVTDGGSISGVVSFEGTPPKPRVVTVTKDTKVAKDKTREIDVVRVKDGKVAEAVVYLKKVKAGKDWPAVKDGGMVDQVAAKFVVHSRVIHAGMEVPVRNSDPVLHNIHAYELIGRGRRTIFNKGQPKNMTLNLEFATKRSPYVKIECDAHNFMHDFLFVADNPYYSVTAADGKFNIPDVPAGNYILMAWHPNLGSQKAKVTVGAAGAVEHNFTFSNDGGSK